MAGESGHCTASGSSSGDSSSRTLPGGTSPGPVSQRANRRASRTGPRRSQWWLMSYRSTCGDEGEGALRAEARGQQTGGNHPISASATACSMRS